MIVDYCVHFLEHAHKLWKESLPEEKFRLQSLIFPEGISYDALTGKQTPKLSPVYEAISEIKKTVIISWQPHGESNPDFLDENQVS